MGGFLGLPKYLDSIFLALIFVSSQTLAQGKQTKICNTQKFKSLRFIDNFNWKNETHLNLTCNEIFCKAKNKSSCVTNKTHWDLKPDANNYNSFADNCFQGHCDDCLLPKLDFEYCNVSDAATNNYTCKCKQNRTLQFERCNEKEKKIWCNKDAKMPSTEEPQLYPEIIGCVFGVAAFIIIVVVLCICISRKRKQTVIIDNVKIPKI